MACPADAGKIAAAIATADKGQHKRGRTRAGGHVSELSISRAWDESKARIAADGKLMVAVAGALIALPALVTGVMNPPTAAAKPGFLSLIVLVVASLVAIVGQLALIRLAIGPAVSVGEAIAHGLRRLPVYFMAAVLILIGLLLLAIPFVLIVAALGLPVDNEQMIRSPAAMVLVFAYLAILIFLAVRMLLTSPVASEEPVGPLAILKRSWALTSGHWLKLFGFIMLFVIGVLIAVTAISMAVGSVAVLLFGEIEPMSASALVVATVEAVVQAMVTVVLAVMLARIYLQLAGDAVETVTVPSSGT